MLHFGGNIVIDDIRTVAENLGIIVELSKNKQTKTLVKFSVDIFSETIIASRPSNWCP